MPTETVVGRADTAGHTLSVAGLIGALNFQLGRGEGVVPETPVLVDAGPDHADLAVEAAVLDDDTEGPVVLIRGTWSAWADDPAPVDVRTAAKMAQQADVIGRMLLTAERMRADRTPSMRPAWVAGLIADANLLTRLVGNGWDSSYCAALAGELWMVAEQAAVDGDAAARARFNELWPNVRIS